MHSNEIILIAIIAVPALLLFWYQINASIIFLSLCLGYVLMQFVSPDAHELLALFSAHVARGIDAGNIWPRIILLLLPPLLTSLSLTKSVKGNKKYLNILPGLGVGLLLAMILSPIFPFHLANNIIKSELWLELKKHQAIIVGLSGLVSVIMIWMDHSHLASNKASHKK
jgi:hypothetical protein